MGNISCMESNNIPNSIQVKDEYWERPLKYSYVEHAERNAIYNAARIGVSTKGCTMYLTCDIPCADCARGIINAGIIKIYAKKGAGAKSKKWDESSKRSMQMFKEAGVEVEWYDF